MGAIVKAAVSGKAVGRHMNRMLAKILGLALLLVALGLGAAGMWLVQRPARYEASATVKIERDQVDLPKLADLPQLAAVAAPGVDDTYFIQTEMALIRSEAILGKVAERLDVNQAWGRGLYDRQTLKSSETLQRLKVCLSVEPGPDAAQIIITAASDAPNEAADIANATAQAYCDYRADYRRRLNQNVLDAVAGKVAEMEKKIARAREKAERAEQELPPALRTNVPTNSPPGREGDALRSLHARYAECVLHYLALSNQLALYQAQSAGDDEQVEELKNRAANAKAKMVAAETAAREELKNRELVRNYRMARSELEELRQIFAPLQKRVAELRNELSPQQQVPARITEPATLPILADPHEADRGKMLLAAGGVTLLAGLALLLFARQSKAGSA
jgi:uncharacterized protein involved in exopolysaccharide biosynthesis